MEDIHIVALAADWPGMREDPRFLELMRLARVANSLALAFAPLYVPHSDQSPRARRDRFAGLFYSAALLKEGMHTARSLGKWFRDLPQYQEGIGALLRDPEVQALESGVLDKIRDELVFHFDRDAMSIGLSRLPADGVVVASYPMSGPEVSETYFEIADHAVLSYLFGDAATSEEYVARLEAFMEGNANLFSQFLSASHRLIAAGLLALGCLKTNVERPSDPKDDVP